MVVITSFFLFLFGVFVNTGLRDFSHLASARTLLAEIHADTLELRHNEKDFLARKDTSYVDRFVQQSSELGQKLDQLEAELNEVDIPVDAIPAISMRLESYTEKFGKIADKQHEIGLHAKDGLYGALRKAVHAAETIINEHEDYRAKAEMLMLRRAEKDFMLRRDLKYLNKFDKSFAAAESAIGTSGWPVGDREAATQKLNSYRSGFKALVDAEQSIGLSHKDGVLGELHNIVHDLETTLSEFSVRLDEAIAQREESTMLYLEIVLGATGVFITVLLAWISVVISRRAGRVSHNMIQAARGDGDLTRRMKIEGNDEFSDMSNAFNEFASKVQDVLLRVEMVVDKVNVAMNDLADAAASTRDNMQGLGSNTQSVAIALEQMVVAARDVAESTSGISTSSQSANTLAMSGQTTVKNSVEKIKAFAGEFKSASDEISTLHTETENIGSILDVIRSIADQTNLLALNAAIEAARAGEYGRGFAVVADEVRTLAHRSQTSTEEIRELITSLQARAETATGMINQSQSRVEESVTQAGMAGKSLEEIVEAIAQVNAMAIQIASAAEEQSHVVGEITGNASSIEKLARKTSSDAEHTSDISDLLRGGLAELKSELSHFKLR